MKKLNIEEYDKLFELVKTYCFSLANPIRIEETRLEISKLLKCNLEDSIKLVDENFPEIYQQITKPIKEDLEISFKGLYFSEIHDH